MSGKETRVSAPWSHDETPANPPHSGASSTRSTRVGLTRQALEPENPTCGSAKVAARGSGPPYRGSPAA
jgi:hypothetical protein